ncbi:MAG: hypothetical protein ABUL67_03855 [Haliangium ochraceum]
MADAGPGRTGTNRGSAAGGWVVRIPPVFGGEDVMVGARPMGGGGANPVPRPDGTPADGAGPGAGATKPGRIG